MFACAKLITFKPRLDFESIPAHILKLRSPTDTFFQGSRYDWSKFHSAFGLLRPCVEPLKAFEALRMDEEEFQDATNEVATEDLSISDLRWHTTQKKRRLRMIHDDSLHSLHVLSFLYFLWLSLRLSIASWYHD
eukprot:symbB.v1.2.032775.t1/scaffold3975.1/size47066/5